MSTLSEAEINGRLAEIPGWEHHEGALQRELRFANFSEAWGFMSRVALVAEKLDHHPDWSNSWNTVRIAVRSHSAGGVTEQCLTFAAKVNAVVEG